MKIKSLIIKLTVIAAFSISVVTTLAAESANESKHHWAIQHWKTPSGIPVYFVETHQLPMVDVQLIFKAGSAYDEEKYGIANLTNTLLNQGTAKLSANQIAEQWDMAGALYNAFIAKDMAIVGMRSLTYPKQFDLARSTLTDILSHPSFPTEAFERNRNLALQTLKQQEQKPGSLAKNAFIKAVYGDHPYGHPSAGTTKTLANLKTEDIKKFYQKYYIAQNAIVTIVGSLTRKQAEQLAIELTSQLGQGNPPKKIPSVHKNEALVQHISFPSSQTHVIMGQATLSRSDPSYFPLTVANYILGGGMGSRLFKTIRTENGLAYAVNSGFSTSQEHGPFYIELQTQGNQARQAVSLVKKVLNEFIAQGPSKEELEASKQHLVKNFLLELSSNQEIMDSLTDIGFYGLPLDYLSTYQGKIQAVTQQQIKEALRKYLLSDRFILITAGKDA